MLKKLLWFLAFVATGIGLLVRSLLSVNNKGNKIVLILVAILFFIGLTVHLRELQDRRK